MTDGALPERVAQLPTQPGVYLFKDARGRVLYVGKAKNLRARVRQYVSGQDERLMVPFLVEQAADVDVVLVHSDKDAILLENTLIKKHRPRFNVKLVDDSSFLHLRIDRRERWPRFHLVRRIQDTKARHFGPFASASRARATLEFVGRRFPLRTCSDRELRSRSRPCLLHQMHRCVAPCVDLCTPEEYDRIVDEALLFLEGRNDELVSRLRARMEAEAEALRFEEAARLRDLIRAIEASIERQHVVDARLSNRDVWGLFRSAHRGVLAVVPIRGGKMQEAATVPLEGIGSADPELLSTLLNTWYGEGVQIPGEILLPLSPVDADALQEVLAERRAAAEERQSAAVKLVVPKRGDKRKVVELANRNAESAFRRRAAREEQQLDALKALVKVCRLPRLPRRIECFDNSNIQGTDPVASMVVFQDGQPHRASYRRYRVKTVVGADDFATMREILGRRLRRGLSEGELPDLLVVDGGHGQLNAAIAVMRELELSIQGEEAAGRRVVPVIGLSKPRTERRRGDRTATDKIVLPGVKNPLRLRDDEPALRLLQQLRDESHRTAVQYHRKVRRRRALSSVLDGLPGVGEERRKALLTHFGSARAVKSATAAQIAEVPGFGPRLSERIAASLATGFPDQGGEDRVGEE